jgi:hypothetical protein
LLAVALLTVAGAACGGGTGSKATASVPTPAPTQLSVADQARKDLAELQASKPAAPTGVAALAPDVQAAVKRQPWGQGPLDAPHKQLVDFLYDASQNLVGVRPDWPYVSRFVAGRFANTPFDADTEVKIVDQGLYDFIPTQSGSVVVVFSSADVDLTHDDVAPVLAGVRKWLPAVEKFVGHPFRTSYLHVQVAGLGAPYDASIQRGSNIFLDARLAQTPDFDFVLAHELTHTFLQLLPMDSRPWLTEGIADLVGGALTGTRVTGYTQAATGEPLPTDINPAFQPSLFSASYSQEAGNGSLFLFSILDAIGPDNMSKVVAGIHDDSGGKTRHANDLFDIIRQNTPPDKKDTVEAIITKWTKRPLPNAAKPTATPQP